jgi:lipoprotein-releasing system ATP-binding protein
MLIVSNVTKSYRTPQGPLPILHGVSLTVDKSHAAAIMGPSGSGKSTLLYILGALEAPSTGTVTLNGENPYLLDDAKLAAFRNRHIGFVFQDHALLPQCSVLENVLAPTLVANTHSAREYAQRARALLEAVGLGARSSHRPAELSGGEKQRVAIARALVSEPTLLLCDEPTGNLDQRNADAVAELLLALHRAQRMVLIVVTHSLELARRFDTRFTLTDGHLAEAP